MAWDGDSLAFRYWIANCRLNVLTAPGLDVVGPEANKFVSTYHDRMPALLTPYQFLAGSGGVAVLRPTAEDYLQTWPVSRRVNSSRAPSDDPTLIEKFELP